MPATKSKPVVRTTKDLAGWLAEDHDLPKSKVEAILGGLFDEIVACVSQGEKVQLHGFGQFYCHRSNARQGRNPQTGESVKIPAKNTPKFKPAAGFKEELAS